MPGNAWDQSARAHDNPQAEVLPLTNEDVDRRRDDKLKGSASNMKAARDKIRCLDGLRGIACLLVFNYHFLWPWTPSIMLGHGAYPPGAPEPYWGWTSLPIICLVHRGRAMVAIFFAISGYVLCRHILRAIHERRLETVYKSLASAVFRRAFRLYIPPTISMFLVAMLAQMGAFRSEDDIFKGPDSVYINGTVTVAQLNRTCITGVHGSMAATRAIAIADYLGLESSDYLGQIAEITGEQHAFCVNATSRLYGPSSLYGLVDRFDAQLRNDTVANSTNTTTEIETLALYAYRTIGGDERKAYEYPYSGPVPIIDTPSGVNISRKFNYTGVNLTWVQLGGSWEEHPFIHDNITYALQNFTRAYAEWANPFNFGHYHPRYDPHTFTIPMELRGSMFVYIFLLATAAIKAKWRLSIAGGLSAYSLSIGRWDMATFLGGTVLSELDIRASSDLSTSTIKGGRAKFNTNTRGGRITRWVGIFVALYFLSYPDAAAEYTPGFVYLASWVPRYYYPLSGWMFYQALGSLLLLPCILRSSTLRDLLEASVPQYLGKISFSLYLIHGPVLHSLGFWIMPRLFDSFGRSWGFAIGWFILMTTSLYLADQWCKRIDGWSVSVGKRVEQLALE